MYQLFYDGEEPPIPISPNQKTRETEWGSRGKDALVLANFRRFLGRMNANDRKLLLSMAQKMARSL
jgi:hypothetical protein